MATPQVKDLILHSPSGSSELIIYTWPLQIGRGQDKHDNGVDIIETIKFVCDEIPSISFAFDEMNFNEINTACPQTMTSLVDKFNKAVDSLVALEKGTSLPQKRLNKFAKPALLKHIIQLVYNGAVVEPDKLNQYEPFSPEVYGETSFELILQMVQTVTVPENGNFIDLGSGVGQIVLQMAGSFALKSCVGIEKADTPARYAERMDALFRQYMAWFGKRFSEYKLIKGDFLEEEFRSKIVKANLIFVNNFAFGPSVDHQLKLFFSDVADGTNIVSSKSFCPLNFRTTERNLNDLGSIVHVREMPSLKGSVSWTCKPVSYYIHEMDRSLLQNYYDSKKSKGAYNQQFGDSREGKKRGGGNAKRANGILKSSVVAGISVAKKKAQIKQQQQQRLLQKQRSTEAETSATESEGDGLTNVTVTSNSESQMSNSKCENDSLTDDEENNNVKKLIKVPTTATIRNGQLPLTAAQKQRRKLTRQAAIASKTAAAAQRVADAEEARELEIATQRIVATNRHESLGQIKDEYGSSTATTTTTMRNVGGRKGRLKKGARGRKSANIVGLDALHQHTLLSTTEESMKKYTTPAPGTVNQQLTSILGDMKHEELPIPESPMEEPYALDILMANIRRDYLAMLKLMKAPNYRNQIQIQLEKERAHRTELYMRGQQLEKQLRTLTEEGIDLLKQKMSELGVTEYTPNALFTKARGYVSKYREFFAEMHKKKEEVSMQEIEHKRLLYQNIKDLPEFHKRINQFRKGNAIDFTEENARDIVLKEILNEVSLRNNLTEKMKMLVTQCNDIEEMSQKQQIEEKPSLKHSPLNNNVANQNPNGIVQIKTNGSINSSSSKGSRRSRDNRSRNHDWPDVPDIGKIEESNPEVLAQKILETGRQIEAKKAVGTVVPNGKYHAEDKRTTLNKQPSAVAHAYLNQKDSTLMPAPTGGKQSQSSAQLAPRPVNCILPKCELPDVGRKHGLSTLAESPKVANFEDRIKSIITSTLNGDRERKQPVANNAIEHNYNQQPTAKRFKHIHSPNISTNSTNNPVSTNNSNYSHTNVNYNGYAMPANVMHLNGNTTISPVTPPLPIATHIAASAPHPSNNAVTATSYNKYATSQINCPQKYAHNINATGPTSINKDSSPCSQMNKSQQQYQTASNVTHIVSAPQLPPQSSSSSSSIVNGGLSVYEQAEMAFNRRRITLGYDQFMIQQQQQQHHHQQQQQQQSHAAYLLAAQAAHQQRNHLTPPSPNTAHQNYTQMHHQNVNQRRCLEFKAPPVSDRSSSREHLDELLIPRSSSASSSVDMPSAVPLHYVPTRDRLLMHDRSSSSTESAASQPIVLHSPAALTLQPVRPSSRPSSTSSQPDYTQVSPAKMALRRHLSQEKLNLPAHHVASAATLNGIQAPMTAKTIGDLVNVEIERRLELTNPNNYAADLERINKERLLINPNVQRPERVHVRLQNDEQVTVSENGIEDKPPFGHNLATLVNVAITQKTLNTNSSTGDAMSPLIRDYNICNTGSNSNMNGNSRQQLTQTPTTKTPIKYQPVQLPRAEMKGCIEAYFNEEQRQQQQKKDRGTARPARLNGANPPLEGLAASLQDHVLARKFREESEERQRRVAASSAPFEQQLNFRYNGEHQPLHGAHFQDTNQVANPYNRTVTSQKAEIILKRDHVLLSPDYTNRPMKQPRYAHESSSLTHRNTYAHGNNIGSNFHQATPSPSVPVSPSSTAVRRNGSHKIQMEPLLMSPEVNSMIGDDRSMASVSDSARLYNSMQYTSRHNSQTYQNNHHQSRPIMDQSYVQRHHQGSSSSSSIVPGNCRHKADDGKIYGICKLDFNSTELVVNDDNTKAAARNNRSSSSFHNKKRLSPQYGYQKLRNDNSKNFTTKKCNRKLFDSDNNLSNTSNKESSTFCAEPFKDNTNALSCCQEDYLIETALNEMASHRCLRHSNGGEDAFHEISPYNFVAREEVISTMAVGEDSNSASLSFYSSRLPELSLIKKNDDKSMALNKDYSDNSSYDSIDINNLIEEKFDTSFSSIEID